MGDAIYVLKSGGRAPRGYLLIGAGLLLALIIIIDGGLGDLPTGAGFIALLATWGWLFFLTPHVLATPSGISSVGPFRTVTIPWADVRDIYIRWGMKIERADGRVIDVPAFPTTGSITRLRYSGDDIEDYFSGRHEFHTTSRKAAQFLQDRAEDLAGATGSTLIRWHWERIGAWTLALAALAANIAWLSTR